MEASNEIQRAVLGLLVNHVRMVLVAELVDLKDLRVSEVVTNQESVFLPLEPSFRNRENAGTMLRGNLEHDVIHDSHMVS